MKTVLTLLCLFSLACHSHALKCYTCSSSSEEQCVKEGTVSCPAHTEACASITTHNIVIRSCSYMDFCKNKNNSGAKIECCFADECNRPRHSQQVSTAGALSTSPLVLITPLLLLLHNAFCQF